MLECTPPSRIERSDMLKGTLIRPMLARIIVLTSPDIISSSSKYRGEVDDSEQMEHKIVPLSD